MSVYVITSEIGCEPAFASLVVSIYGNHVIPLILSKKELNDDEQLRTFLKTHKCNDILFLFGDYWKNLEEIKSEFPEVPIERYLFDRPFSSFQEKYNLNEDIDLELLTMLDQRCASLNTEGTQPLITGMSNILIDDDDSVYGKYLKLFSGKIKFEEVLLLGESLVNSQKALVKDRIKRYSRTGVTKDGYKYSITQSCEFVNMAHDELKRVYPDVDLTIVAFFNFATDGDTLSHSMRSYRDDINVKSLVELHNGGGNSKMGGCQQSIDLLIDY